MFKWKKFIFGDNDYKYIAVESVAPNSMKQTLLKIKDQINPSRIAVKENTITLSWVDDSARQKVNLETRQLNFSTY